MRLGTLEVSLLEDCRKRWFMILEVDLQGAVNSGCSCSLRHTMPISSYVRSVRMLQLTLYFLISSLFSGCSGVYDFQCLQYHDFSLYIQSFGLITLSCPGPVPGC